MAIKKNGGVVQTVAFDGYVKIKPPDSPERAAALAEVRKAMPAGGPGEMTDEQRAQFRAKMAEVNKAFPAPRATVADFVNHVDYLVKKVGVDHVGISSDFDGGGGVDGWSGADETFNVTLELVRRGYTEEQIGKLWSGNLLRVMDAVQRVAANLQKTATVAVGLVRRVSACIGSTSKGGGVDEKALFVGFWTSESQTTRKVLSRIPEGSTYKPDPKSRTAQDIAWQIVCEEKMLIDALEKGVAEWAPPPMPATMAEVLASYDAQSAGMPERWAALPDERWTGTMDFFGAQRPASQMAWGFLFDIVHHRGQI